ncbi:MAG: hypothetical protein AAF702_45750 [Chloroflexota bacterium]
MDDLWKIIASIGGNENKITINRVYISAMGDDLVGGLFLGELLFWSQKADQQGWFWLDTDKMEANHLTEYARKKYTKILLAAGTIETKKQKVNTGPRLHFRIITTKMSELILSAINAKKACQNTVSAKSPEPEKSVSAKSPKGDLVSAKPPERFGETARTMVSAKSPEPIYINYQLTTNDQLPIVDPMISKGSSSSSNSTSTPKIDDDDDDFELILNMVSKNFNQLVTEELKDEIQDMLSEHPASHVESAIRKAVQYGGKTIAYVKAILADEGTGHRRNSQVEDRSVPADFENLVNLPPIEPPPKAEPEPVERGEEAQAIWAEALELLETALPPATYDTWLSGSVGLGIRDGNLVVGVKDEYTCEFAKSRLATQARRALSKLGDGTPAEAIWEIAV